MDKLAKKNFAPWQKVITAFYASQTASTLGTGLVQFALIWYITFRTNSGLALTIMTIASFLPQLLIALVSGVWADRYDRRWVIILADGGIALASLAVAIIFINGYEHIWLIFLVSAIRSLGGGIQGPAITALIPQIVPRKSLIRVNGIYNTLGNITQLLSPILGGAMILILPIWAIFMIDVVTAAIAITIMLVLPLPHQRTGLVANAFGVNKKEENFDWGFPSGAVATSTSTTYNDEELELEDDCVTGAMQEDKGANDCLCHVHGSAGTTGDLVALIRQAPLRHRSLVYNGCSDIFLRRHGLRRSAGRCQRRVQKQSPHYSHCGRQFSSTHHNSCHAGHNKRK